MYIIHQIKIIHRKLSQILTTKWISLFKYWEVDVNRHLYKKDIGMANNIKKCVQHHPLSGKLKIFEWQSGRWECCLVEPIWKTILKFLKVRLELSFNSTIPQTQRYQLKKIYVHQYHCYALYNSQTWKQFNGQIQMNR